MPQDKRLAKMGGVAIGPTLSSTLQWHTVSSQYQDERAA